MLANLANEFKRLLSDVVWTVWNGVMLLWLTIRHVGAAFINVITPDVLRPQRSLTGRVALVTGGAGGVGRQLALRFARCGAPVVLWDVNEQSLKNARHFLVDNGVPNELLHTYVVDVSDKYAVKKNAELVIQEVGPVQILVNNAGIVHGKSLLDLSEQQIEDTYHVNILSHYWTTKCFLPEMLQLGWGHVVTVASVAGLMGTYLCTDYSATKFAAVGFHESLLTELRTNGHNSVSTTLICPYYIDTGMFTGVQPRLLPMLRPEDVAARIVRAVRRDEVLVVMPTALRYLLPLKSWLPPELSWAIMYHVLRGPQAMKTFRGHTPSLDSGHPKVPAA